mgnify:CR=1 FL=1
MLVTPGLISPLHLIGSQVESESIALPTGARIFRKGSLANSIYALRQGIVEVRGERGERICYRPGELFSYQDIVWREAVHSGDALARTPVEVLRLDRLQFLGLLHNHPTLALLLLGQQHERLREQRAEGSCCY